MNPLRSSRALAGIVILLVGLAGVAIGAALDHTVDYRRKMEIVVGGRMPKGPRPEVRKWVLSRLERELDLTKEQSRRVDSVLIRREADVRSLMLEMRPRFEEISARTRRDIQAALTPDQRKKFIEMSRHDDPTPAPAPPPNP